MNVAGAHRQTNILYSRFELLAALKDGVENGQCVPQCNWALGAVFGQVEAAVLRLLWQGHMTSRKEQEVRSKRQRRENESVSIEVNAQFKVSSSSGSGVQHRNTHPCCLESRWRCYTR